MNEWKFLTADEIVKWYGERCSDTEPGCPTCAAWLRYDTLRQWEYEAVNERIENEMDEPPKTGIKVGVRFLNEAQDYPINEAVRKMMDEENERIDAEVDERLRHYSPEFVFDPAIHTVDAFIPPRSLEIAAKKMFTRLMLERKIGDQDPDPYAGSEWAGGREG